MRQIQIFKNATNSDFQECDWLFGRDNLNKNFTNQSKKKSVPNVEISVNATVPPPQELIKKYYCRRYLFGSLQLAVIKIQHISGKK
jgi:hypothetical protein